MHHNSDLANEWLWIYLYTYEKGTGLIALSTCNLHLTALFTDTHTDKYDLKVWHSTLRTVTNSFTLRARNNVIVWLYHWTNISGTYRSEPRWQRQLASEKNGNKKPRIAGIDSLCFSAFWPRVTGLYASLYQTRYHSRLRTFMRAKPGLRTCCFKWIPRPSGGLLVPRKDAASI